MAAMMVSARTGEGVEGLRDWLTHVGERAKAPA